MHPGEYAQPLNRTTSGSAPIESGFVGLRFRASQKPTGTTQSLCQVLLENTGKSQFTVLIQGTDNHSPAGTRAQLSEVVLMPGGQKTVSVTPVTKYIEFEGSAGSGNLKVQITSEIRWEPLAFSKVDTEYDILGLTQAADADLDASRGATTVFGQSGSAGEVTS